MRKILLACALLLGASIPAAAASGCYSGGYSGAYSPSYHSGGYGCGTSYHRGCRPSCGTVYRCGGGYHSGGYYPGYVYGPCGKRYVGKYYWPAWKRPDIVVYEQPYSYPYYGSGYYGH